VGRPCVSTLCALGPRPCAIERRTRQSVVRLGSRYLSHIASLSAAQQQVRVVRVSLSVSQNRTARASPRVRSKWAWAWLRGRKQDRQALVAPRGAAPSGRYDRYDRYAEQGREAGATEGALAGARRPLRQARPARRSTPGRAPAMARIGGRWPPVPEAPARGRRGRRRHRSRGAAPSASPRARPVASMARA